MTWMALFAFTVGGILAVRWLTFRWDSRGRAVSGLFKANRREFKARERACEKYINQRIEHYRRPL